MLKFQWPVKITTKRKYEGASKSKRLSRWFAPNTSSNAATASDLGTLRNRARDLRRNNPYAAKGIQVITANTIGHGISTQFRGGPSAKRYEETWAEWAETTAIDFDGRSTIYGLQRIIMDAVAESGEVLVRKRFMAGKKFPLQYQVLEADFLDITKTSIDGATGNNIIQGIEFDKQGRRVAYHLFENHPGGYDPKSFAASTVTNRIPAEQIYHIYRIDRPGQARGIPWLAPVIVRLRDLDEYQDAQIMRQKIAAAFAAFVQDINADVDAETETTCELGDKIDPGSIEFLPPGKTVTFPTPPSTAGYNDFVKGGLQSVAAGLGVTYEALTSDLSQVNFSSGRMGWIEMGRNINTWREHIIYAHFLDPVVSDFKQVMQISGVTTRGISHVHVPPKRELIDPTKEIPATIKAIRAGLSTLSDEIMAQGKDPEAQLEQYSKDMDMLDKLKITVTSDARQKEDTTGGAINSNTQGGTET